VSPGLHVFHVLAIHHLSELGIVSGV